MKFMQEILEEIPEDISGSIPFAILGRTAGIIL